MTVRYIITAMAAALKKMKEHHLNTKNIAHRKNRISSKYLLVWTNKMQHKFVKEASKVSAPKSLVQDHRVYESPTSGRITSSYKSQLEFFNHLQNLH